MLQNPQAILIKGQFTHMTRFERIHLENPKYYQWITDIDVVRYIGRNELLTGITFSEAERYVQELWDNKFCTFLAVYHTASNSFIGTAKINFINEQGRKNGIADIGIMIGERNYWGKGLASDILRTACRFAFEKMHARKLTAGAMSPNIAVIMAFKRIGFIEEGRLRQQLITPDCNSYCDHVLFGCFKGELN